MDRTIPTHIQVRQYDNMTICNTYMQYVFNNIISNNKKLYSPLFLILSKERGHYSRTILTILISD